ncbi:hypothetical protein MASR2M48_33100 [Spirochaetota bacterium]
MDGFSSSCSDVFCRPSALIIVAATIIGIVVGLRLYRPSPEFLKLRQAGFINIRLCFEGFAVLGFIACCSRLSPLSGPVGCQDSTLEVIAFLGP